MRQFLSDRRGSYGVLLLIGAFAVCVVTVGYFISVAGIHSSARGEAVGHATTYQSISRQDLLRILEKAALVTSMEGGANGWNESQVDERFKEVSERWITSYLEGRGVYEVNITVEKRAEMREKNRETYVDLGRYVITISGRGAKTVMVVE
jgi:hypothetical protein